MIGLQRAASELVRAENELDAANRQFAAALIVSERFQEAVAARREELGRDLTDEEREALLNQVARPTPRETAELVAWSALHDAREWTRFEMALIEAIWPDYPHDVRAGSTYADLEPFRKRVRRLAAGDDSATDDEPAVRVTPIYRWADAQTESLSELSDTSSDLVAADEQEQSISGEQEESDTP